ncbi:MAG: hypothetical protein LBK25_07935 [Treponema sp.]|jgi:hypothetical protein|nr:hypothetical protein [Treponema sp.]
MSRQRAKTRCATGSDNEKVPFAKQAHPSGVLKPSCRRQRVPLSNNTHCEVFTRLAYGVSAHLPNNAQAPLVYKRSRQDWDSGAPFLTIPVVKYLNTPRVRGQRTFQTTRRFRLQSKRNRQDGVSGSTFRTTTRVKSSNRLCLPEGCCNLLGIVVY